MKISLGAFIRDAVERLRAVGVPNPEVDVAWLVEHGLDVPRMAIPLHSDRILTSVEYDSLTELIARRTDRVPLQHVIGWVPFLDVRIKVSPAALIPRPETEILATTAIDELKRALAPGRGRVLDIGTGTGCLAVALAQAVPSIEVWAVDVSPEALALAQDNVSANGVGTSVHLVESDLLEGLDPERTFDLVVSNPPYIPQKEIEALQPEVRDHDPRLALDGGQDGTDIYAQLARSLSPFLKLAGKVMLEIGDGQGDEVCGLFAEQGFRTVDRIADLSGVERVLVFERGEGG